jgi:hypothetical protein
MRLLTGAIALGLALASPVAAQVPPARDSAASPTLAPMTPGMPSTAAADRDLSGSGLPDRTASTTAVGRTKPPGAPVGDGLGTRPDLEVKSRELDRKINTGICSGCK